MSIVTIEIPEALNAKLVEVAQSRGTSESELISEALQEYLSHRHQQPPAQDSFTALAGDLIGCASGGPLDLSTNKKHLDGYGQSE